MRKMIWICVAIVVLAVFAAPFGKAQTLDKLKTDLDSARSDAQSLERILQELSVLDSAYTPSFPSWEMDEPNLRLRVFAAFRNRGKQFTKNDKIMITTMPDSQTIIDLKIGDVSYGKLYSQTLLARDLRTDLLAEARLNEPPTGLKSRVSEESNPMARPSNPDWVAADFSLFGMSLRFGNDWGIVGRIGDDELGYLWWSTGNARIMGAYKSLKIGAWVPILGGLNREDVEGTGRLINGSDGLAGEFEFEWETIRINSESFPYAAIGGSFAVGGLTGRRLEFLTPNIDSLYYLARIIQGYYAFDFLFDEKRQNLNVHLGASYHQVNIGKAVIIDDGYKIFKGGEPESFIDPLIRIEYRNYRFDRFRVAAQFTRLLMFSGWAEVVPPFMYAEIRFSAVVFRNPRAWEHSSYVMGTLGFKFDF